MEIELRDAGAADYEAIGAVLDAVMPDARISGAELWETDEAIRASGLTSDRVVALVGGAPAGYAVYGDIDWSADTSVWIVGVRVAPDRVGRGIGRTLHARVVEIARRAGKVRLFAEVEDRVASGIRFAEAAGYRRIGFGFESHLDLSSLPPDAFRGEASHPGLHVTTLATVRATSRDWFDRLYALYSTLESDIPSPFPIRPVPEATFRARHVDSDQTIPEGFFIALDGDEWVGLTELRRIGLEPTWLQQELTGVIRSHRRRGIAMHLKGVAARWAADNGFTRIRTWNDNRNEGMLAVNEQLGFVRGHTVAHYLLDL